MKKNAFYFIATLLIQLFVYLSVKYLMATKFKRNQIDIFTKTLIIILILHISFAIFSEGNAEFMVMVPILILLIVNQLYNVKPQLYLSFGFLFLTWNLTFAIIPNNIYDYTNNQKLITLIEKKKNAVFILADEVLVQNIMYYNSGIRWNNNIYKSPQSLSMQKKSTAKLNSKIDSCLTNHIEIFTDCINQPKVIDRKQYFSKNEDETFFKSYYSSKIDSFETFYGKKYIYKITGYQ